MTSQMFRFSDDISRFIINIYYSMCVCLYHYALQIATYNDKDGIKGFIAYSMCHHGSSTPTFPHYVLLNVSPNFLNQNMHSHTGCICFTFPHYASLNVSLKHLPERMHNYTGCICLTFLHCVFLNVFSTRSHEQMPH